VDSTNATDELPFATIWNRFAAWSIDAVMFGALMWVLGALMSGFGVFIGFVAYLLYSAVLEGSRYGATFGKYLLSVRVTDLDGRPLSARRSAGRTAGKVVSGAVFPFGHLIATFTDGRSALHDLLAGTVVLRSR
jgi:uncharacterized RDD family membrane protein YckC